MSIKKRGFLAVLMVVSTALLGLSYGASHYFRNNSALNCMPQGSFVEIEGQKIHYIERPGGEIPLLMIHGASSSAIDYQLSLFDQIPEKFHLIAIDRPGLAHSQRTFPREQALSGQTETIHKAALQLFGRPAYIMSHSLGGVIGARLLSDYPDHYQGMLGIAPALYPIGDGKSWYTILAELPVLGFLARHLVVPWAGYLIAPGIVRKNFDPNPVPNQYEEKACVELMFEPDRFLNNAYDLNLIRPYLDESYLLYEKIKQPVTLIYGESDKILAKFSHGYGFQYKVPHAKLIMLKETGHLPHHTYPGLVVESLEALLQQKASE